MTELKINTYPMHIGDWHSGTSRMSLAERGAYITLCNQYYLDQGEGWTVNECLRICAAMAKDEQKAVKSVLASKFEQVDGGYRHSGMGKRIAEIVAASERNQERARVAAEKRWAREKQSSPDATSNAPSTATSMPEAMLEECHPKAKSHKEERVYKNTLSSDGGPTSKKPAKAGKPEPASPAKWDGIRRVSWAECDPPPEIRQAVVEAMGTSHAIKFLDQCAVFAAPSTILTVTQLAADELKRVKALRDNYTIEKLELPERKSA